MFSPTMVGLPFAAFHHAPASIRNRFGSAVWGTAVPKTEHQLLAAGCGTCLSGEGEWKDRLGDAERRTTPLVAGH